MLHSRTTLDEDTQMIGTPAYAYRGIVSGLSSTASLNNYFISLQKSVQKLQSASSA